MKPTSTLSLLLLLAVTILSCTHNRLKTNAKELAKEIIIQEKENAETQKAEHDKQLADTVSRPARAFRLKEDRSVDPVHPPVLIDIAGSLNNVKEIKLSDVASTVEYIRMQHLPDSSIPTNLKFKYYLMDNNFVAVNLYGIHLYSKDGRYVHSIVKNRYTGIKFIHDFIMFLDDFTKIGGGLAVWAKGNNLFYNYSNNITGEKYIMEFDCSSIQLIPDYKFDPERPDKISGLGKVAVDLNHGKTKPPKPVNSRGMSGGDPEWFYREREPFLLGQDYYSMPQYENNIMVILDNHGDTLSVFEKLEKLKDYTKQMMRWGDLGNQYELNGKQYIRTGFNDTVFQVVPPNRFFPVYILHLGNFKTSIQEGVDPDYDLNGKIIPIEWAETNKFIFITYSKDSFDCPNTRKKRTVKIYHALYTKLSQQFSIIKGDPYDYSPEILENNLDGGMPVWPSSYMTGKNGEILIPLKGKEIKNRVESNLFKLSTAPESKKNYLVKFSRSLSDNDDILMIVK